MSQVLRAWTSLARLVRDEWKLIAFIGVVCAISSVVFVLGQFGQAEHDFIETWLRASWSKPWGIATAIFVHADFDHYSGNMYGLLGFLPFFAFANWSLEHAANRRVAVSIWMVFGSAVVANLLVFVLQPGSSPFGASGVVYAVIGVILGFSLVNSLYYTLTLMKKRKKAETNGLAGFLCFANWVIFLPLFIFVRVWPAAFAGLGEGVNAAGHILAFIAGILASALDGLWIVPGLVPRKLSGVRP